MDGPPASGPAPGGDPDGVPLARWAVAILCLGYALKWADAQILSVTLPAIRAAFRLDDLALGLLGGLPFALFYSALGLPLARAADRGSRRAVVALSLGAFSAATALGGAATSFALLFAARVGVAVGEAGATPAAQSLIGDLVAPRRQGGAFAVYAAAANAGILLGFAGGGWLASRVGWRGAFLGLGLAGLPVAALTRFALPEPRRARPRTPGPAEGSLGRALRAPLADPAFRHLAAGSSLAAVAAFAALAWIPSFLFRDHGMGEAASGAFLGLASGVLGGVGTVASGLVADRRARGRGEAARPRFVALCCLVAWPPLLGFYLAPGRALALSLFLVPACLGAAYAGPVAAAVRARAPRGDQAVAFSLLLFLVNAVGTVLGPIAAGALSQALSPVAHADALRLALAATTLALPWAAFHFRRAAAFIPPGTIGKTADTRPDGGKPGCSIRT